MWLMFFLTWLQLNEIIEAALEVQMILLVELNLTGSRQKHDFLKQKCLNLPPYVGYNLEEIEIKALKII